LVDILNLEKTVLILSKCSFKYLCGQKRTDGTFIVIFCIADLIVNLFLIIKISLVPIIAQYNWFI